MGRGCTIYLGYAALALLLVTSPAKAGLWDADIDLGPAPSPKDGPPFSAHATRDRALLPYEIIGVVGAYLGSVLILGTLLLTVGRSLRKRAQTMADRPTEMVKPAAKFYEPSPVSPPGSVNFGLSKNSTRTSVSKNDKFGSPIANSVKSFHEEAMEQHRRRDQEALSELTKQAWLYEAERRQQTGPYEERVVVSPGSARKPPRLATNGADLFRNQCNDSYPQTPRSPEKTPVAILPPQNFSKPRTAFVDQAAPISPTYSTQSKYTEQRRARGSSFGSQKTVDSGADSSPRKLRKPLRQIRISSPLHRRDNSDGARTPLSPSAYVNTRRAPEIPSARTEDSYQTPTTPGTGRSDPFPIDEDFDEVRDLPRAEPQRISDYQYDNEAQAVTDAASLREDPVRTTPQNRRAHMHAANGNGALPFRQDAYAQTIAQQGMFPLSPRSWNHGQPTATRRTEVEVRPSRLAPGLRTGQQTPYSPYMPERLVTPVTPHLTTRDERRQRHKEEKSARGIITEEDQVADEKDMWSSGY